MQNAERRYASSHDAPDPLEIKKRLGLVQPEQSAASVTELPQEAFPVTDAQTVDVNVEPVVLEVVPPSQPPMQELQVVSQIEEVGAAHVPAESIEVQSAEPTFRMDDAPAVPADAPEAKKWYQTVLGHARAYVEAGVERVTGAKAKAAAQAEMAAKKSAALEALNQQRIAWHELSAQFFSEDADQSQAAIEAAIGRQLDLGGGKRYVIDKFLGQGSYGVTFLAKDEQNNTRVVKLSAPFDRRNIYSNDPSDATEPRALIMEVAALKRLTKLGKENPGPALIEAQFMPDPRTVEHHPDGKIIANDRLAVVVMEYVEGQTLDQFAHAHQQQPLATVEAVQQVVAGLEQAHQVGIIHGDIKPANIMVSKDGKVKLIDFGAAVIPELRRERIVERQGGTFQIAPPEYAQQANPLASRAYSLPSEVANPSRDAYSVGRTIQRLVFGMSRFQSQDAMLELEPSLSYPMREMAGIAKKLTRRLRHERLSLQKAQLLLEELKHTEQQIEATQANIQEVA